MIYLKKVQTLQGDSVDIELSSNSEITIDAKGLLLLPALIDPHVHLRTPGLEYKEDWKTAAKAAIYGGITTVFDMPNTIPATISYKRLLEKKQLIEEQLSSVNIPLRFGLYLGADKNHFHEIAACKDLIIGLKLFMGSSTGDLLIDDESHLHAIFSLAASHDLLLAVHAEDETLMRERKKLFPNADPCNHSIIRNEEVALRATQKALELAKIYKTRLYLLHIGTKAELEAIRRAKESGVKVFAETTPHHLFLTIDSYKTHGTKVQMNPPIRSQENVDALWEAIKTGVIDTIGSDHAPHTLEEKNRPYGEAPSGIPGLETTLPLLLNAHNEGKLSLSTIVRLMREKPLEIFRQPANDDYILVDLHKTKIIEPKLLKTKCGWSPYEGRQLKGWPVITILRGQIYELVSEEAPVI
ncbi:MAG TPA: dihydroorotase [Rhabdochlamydiaceae bacterium]|nr:dihydroorotase [Rhabdochlamydiaceae bacterium]